MGTAGSEKRGRSGKAGVATRVRLVLAACLLAASGVLWLVVSGRRDALFPAYRSASKAVESLLADVTGVVPFAIWDFLTLGLVVWAIVALVRAIRARRSIVPWLSWVALVSALTLSLFCGWALNHYAPPLSQEIGLDVREYTTDELADATAHYLQSSAELAGEVAREDDGTLSDPDFFGTARLAGRAYTTLGDTYEVFSGGSDAPAKALLLWGTPLLYSGYVGIFWAPTGESGVPLDCAAGDLGFIMCHEVAHRLGIASEEEANFAAYLACSESDDAYLRYSGEFNAFCYCANALLSQDPERAQQVVSEALESDYGEGAALVIRDRADTIEHYDSYESDFEQVGDAVNDTYLKGFGEEGGVRSYGLVVDYLIAWHQANPGS